MLEPDEPAFDAVPADCRVTGYAMHALADAFLLHAQKEREASTKPATIGNDYASVQQRERQQRGFFTLEEAAQALGVQEGMHAGARGSLQERMVEAVRDGSLIVRDPHTDLPFRPSVARSFHELVAPGDVNAWLERAGVGYRWRFDEPDPIAADAAGAADEPEGGGADAGAADEPGPQRQAPNAKRWTPELIAEARALVDRLKAEGERDPMKAAAKRFDVSTARLREVLNNKTAPRAAGAHWPATATRRHRIE